MCTLHLELGPQTYYDTSEYRDNRLYEITSFYCLNKLLAQYVYYSIYSHIFIPIQNWQTQESQLQQNLVPRQIYEHCFINMISYIYIYCILHILWNELYLYNFHFAPRNKPQAPFPYYNFHFAHRNRPHIHF